MNQNLDGMVIPRHVALILDGNGRWAKKRGLPRTMGHKEGCVTVEKTVEVAARMGIEYLTVYGFSTENWKRSSDEVGALTVSYTHLLYVTDCLWPDFNQEELEKAILSYNRRDRRFGGVK